MASFAVSFGIAQATGVGSEGVIREKYDVVLSLRALQPTRFTFEQVYGVVRVVLDGVRETGRVRGKK